MTYPGTHVSILMTPQDIRDQMRRIRKARYSLARYLKQCESTERKEVERMMKDGEDTLADLAKAIPAAERMEREKRAQYNQMLAEAEAAQEEKRKERLEMAKKSRKAKKAKVTESTDALIEAVEEATASETEAEAKAAAPAKKKKGKKKAAAASGDAAADTTVAPAPDKKETYQDSILAVMNGKDMPYATIMKAVIDRRVEANLMTRPKGPNGACGAALKKMVVAGVLTMPTRGVYAVAKA